MREPATEKSGYVDRNEIFVTEVSTGVRANCHVCGSRGVELVHVNHIRKENVYHKCPVCKSRIGVNGPHSGCRVCSED